MQAKFLTSLRGPCLIAGFLLALTAAPGAALPADAFPTFDSYVKISGQSAWINGNEAAFQNRTQQPKNGGAGIEDLHYSSDFDKDKTLELDGRALYGAEDYLAKLRLSKNEFGSIEIGYKSFRTFYDGIGGFFPLNKQWNAMNPEDLHVDRGEFWAEAKFNRPNMPEFDLKYTDGFRTGKKDSTIWGDSDFTGLPLTLAPNPVSQVRKMVPSYRDLDEHHQTLEGSMKYTLGKTTLNLSLIKEKTDDNDTRYGTRFPGEVIPWAVASLSSTASAATGISPQNAAKAKLAPANWNNQIVYSQTEGSKTDLAGVTVKIDTVLSEKFSIEAGANYQDLTSDFSGDRPLWTSTPTAVGIIVVPTDNNLNLLGSSKVKVYTGNLAFSWKPTKDTLVKLAVAGEDRYTKSAGTLTAVTAAVNTTSGVITTTNSNQAFNSRVKEKSLTPALDLRYSGFKDLALYASASVRNVDGDERYVTPTATTVTSIPNGNLAYNNTSEDRVRITVGANWRTASFLTLRGEAFHKDNTNKSVGYIVRSDGFVDNYDLKLKYDGVKLTAIAKPNAMISFTTRYVYQKGTGDIGSTAVTGNGSVATPYVASYPDYNSMKLTNYMLGETIDWTPSRQFYVQANANITFNVISTVYPRAGITPAVVNSSGTTTAAAWDTNGVLHNSNNNYVTLSLLAGAVLTKTDDLQFQYIYYKADNGDATLATLTMPYGAAAKQSIATLGLKHKFSDRLIGNLKFGYCDSKNDTTGGNTNFRGPLGYISLDVAL